MHHNVGILDAKIGNVRALANMLDRLSISNEVLEAPKNLDGFTAFILPGVGKFDYCMAKLEMSGFNDFVQEAALANKEILGICIGMHLLCSSSSEGSGKGLNLLPYPVIPIQIADPQIKQQTIMGRHRIQCISKKYEAVNKLYFTHSFGLSINKHTIAKCSDNQLAAIVKNKQITGIQAHPEKSGSSGMQFFKSWLNI